MMRTKLQKIVALIGLWLFLLAVLGVWPMELQVGPTHLVQGSQTISLR